MPQQEMPLDTPVLNGPYDAPSRHFVIGPRGPTGEIVAGRRPSESFIPVPPVRKGRAPGRVANGAAAQQLSLAITEETRQENALINAIRRDVEIWRNRGYAGATAISTKLLRHWADPHSENRILFAQREAAETAIYLAEIASRRQATRRWGNEIDEHNSIHNDGIPRIALKMATGSGKTVVMAMLIAWQTLNKVASPSNPRYAKRFLVITPGITIRDRLRVLQPNDPGNYYNARGIVPDDLTGLLGKAQIIITNYHSFLLKEGKEFKGVSMTTKKLLASGRSLDVFKETEAAMVSRVLRGFGGGKQSGEIVILNDEAHHCYIDKPLTPEAAADGVEAADADDKARNEDARVWFKGIRAIQETVGVKAVYDLSATPFYLGGSGYKEGYIFPWTVSDFSLMDAIESGIVKAPRIPVDDDTTVDVVTFRNLWDVVGKDLPKRARAQTDITTWTMPAELESALHSLYRSYEAAYAHWQQVLAPLDEPPPVFIVVCPNTAVSKLVHDWIAGTDVRRDDGTTAYAAGRLPHFANVDAETGRAHAKPRTILIDSAQLESGEAMKADFKAAAAAEIEAFKAEFRRRNPGADADALTDEDLLREVMNTVGKKGMLGADVRCVVSVAMLTEGWDANTVTHILGIRAFKSQLLCEQVVGRGLRRRSYAVNDEGRFEAEYANVYGVPFMFIGGTPPKDTPPPLPATHVHTVEGREAARITFPKLDGYRLEVADEELWLPEELTPFVIGPGTVPSWTQSAPVVGEPELIEDEITEIRPRAVAFLLAKRLVHNQFALGETIVEDEVRAEPRHWLFPRLVDLCTRWIERAVVIERGWHLGHLAKYAQWQARACDAVYAAITSQQGNRRASLRPILSRHDPRGDTGKVSFSTRKSVLPAADDRCEISHVVLDGIGGNTWEQLVKEECEHNRDVAAYAKNDHLGFSIPYIHEGKSHDYVPDFLVRLKRREGEDFDRVLVIEVSGGQKSKHSPGSVKVKATTARQSWCTAVNNHGGFGRWGYVEITDPLDIKPALADAIQALYADGPIIGDPDLLDVRRN